MTRRLFAFAAALALAALFAGANVPARRPAALGALGRGPTVVLVHGLGSQAEHWLPVARNLGRDHRVVFVDLPGHGLAEMPRELSLEQAAFALDRAIREQGDEPVVLVGHSVGGLVAAAEALRAPGRVRALVLVETALRPQLAPPERGALLAVLAARSWPDSESWAVAGASLGYAAAPGVTPVRVEGVGHFVMLDRPALLADLIRRFARGSGAPVLAAR